MAVSSEYRVNIIISAKDQSSQATKRAVGSWTELKSALGLAKAAFNQVYQAAQKAYQFVEFGASVMRAKTALDTLATGAGTSADAIVNAIQTASNFTIDKMTAMSAANKAMLLGVAQSPEEFERLAKYATLLGRAMGQDAAKSIDDFVVAAGRQSKMIADNLGLMVSAEDAQSRYAATLGKSASALTDAEKKQAFLTEMLRQAEEKTQDLQTAELGFADGLDEVKAALKDTTADLAVMAAETAENTVNTHALAQAIREIPTNLRLAQKAQMEYSASLGEAEAYLNGDAQAIIRFQEAQKSATGVLGPRVQADMDALAEYEDAIDSATYTVGYLEAAQKAAWAAEPHWKTLTFAVQADMDALAEYEEVADSTVYTVGNLAAANKVAAEAAKKAAETYALAVGNFTLKAGMEWKGYFDGVDQQAEDFDTRREQLDAEHQDKIAELLKRGQGKAIKIDEEAETAKLALLQERLAIELQRQAEFTDKTHESQRMAKELTIKQLQGQIADQQKLLDDYHAGRLRTTGENVNALIAEEDRRHKEAVAGLQTEIDKTKELQKQQLGSLMLDTFETWAEIENVPPEAMLNMRTAIAKEYGLISEEEATMIGLSIQSWTNWKNSAYENTEAVITQLNKTITSVHILQQALASLPGGGLGGMGEMVPSMPGAGFYAGVPTASTTNNYNFNQTVNTQATTHAVVNDFQTAQALVQ